MYVMKIYKGKQFFGVHHYKYFENAIRDLEDLNMDDSIPKEYQDTLGKPEISSHSEDDDGIADDFEFRYENGITVYIGKVFLND